MLQALSKSPSPDLSPDCEMDGGLAGHIAVNYTMLMGIMAPSIEHLLYASVCAEPFKGIVSSILHNTCFSIQICLGKPSHLILLFPQTRPKDHKKREPWE